MEIRAKSEALSLFAYHLFSAMLPGRDFASPLTLSCKEADGMILSTASLTETNVTESALLSEHFTPQRAENVACGKALYSLFTSLGASPIPYGTLVGVRPVKMALFYLERKKERAEIIRLLVRDYCMQPDKAALLCDLALLEQKAACSLRERDAMLYLSIPFCPSRCRYCSFISHSAPKQLSLLPQYLARMQQELAETAALFHETGRSLRAVYLGGGTPGVLSARELSGLFEEIRHTFPLAPELELTAELGRPDTITLDKCRALQDCGVGRICINPQTLSDEVLEENGRHHSAADFYRAYEFARKAGVSCINCDLIAGLNADTPEGFEKSLAGLLSLDPENLTIHALCKKRASEEENPIRQDPEHLWAQAMQKAHLNCINNGHSPYYLYRQKHTIANLENLGYAKDGHICLYNIAMMEDLCDVFAVGAGAMTKLRKTTDAGYQMIRLPSYKYPAEYLNDPEKARANHARVRSLLTE